MTSISIFSTNAFILIETQLDDVNQPTTNCLGHRSIFLIIETTSWVLQWPGFKKKPTVHACMLFMGIRQALHEITDLLQIYQPWLDRQTETVPVITWGQLWYIAWVLEACRLILLIYRFTRVHLSSMFATFYKQSHLEYLLISLTLFDGLTL